MLETIDITVTFPQTVVETTFSVETQTVSVTVVEKNGLDGAAFTYEDFTSEQLAALKGDPGSDASVTPIVRTFSEELLFDKNTYNETAVVQSAAIAYTLAALGNIDGNYIRHKILSDGVNTITFGEGFNAFNEPEDNLLPAGVHIIYFNYIGGEVDVVIPTYQTTGTATPVEPTITYTATISSPLEGFSVTEGTPISINTDLVASSGTPNTTSLRYLNGVTLLSEVVSAPFNTYEWTPANGEVGSASLTAEWYVDGVLKATSAAITGTVNAIAGDVTAPTISSATVENANPSILVVVFSEVVTITNVTGLTIAGAATPTLSAPTGSGTNTLSFTLSSPLANGQTVTLEVAGTNNIIDGASNALVATSQAITNNVSAGATATYLGTGTVDPDYQEVLNVALANSRPAPDAAQQTLDNDKIIAVKAQGVFAKVPRVLNLESTADPLFRLICWKTRTLCAVVGTGGTWSNAGWKGDKASAIDPFYNTADAGSLWTLNDAGITWKCFDLDTSGGGLQAITGGFAGNASAVVYIIPNGGSVYDTIHNTASTTALPYGIVGLNAVNRISATQMAINGGTPKAKNSSGVWANKLYIGARHRPDLGVGQLDSHTEQGIGFVLMGANLNAEHAALKTILE